MTQSDLFCRMILMRFPIQNNRDISRGLPNIQYDNCKTLQPIPIPIDVVV